MVCNQSPGMIDWLLELGAARVARPVLRGGGGSDATSLPNQLPRFNFVTHCVTIPLCSPFAASSGTLGMLPTLPAIVLYLKRWKKSAMASLSRARLTKVASV